MPSLLPAALLLLGACTDEPVDSPTSVEGELVFVRDGVVVPAAAAPDEGRALPGDRRLVERAWSAGETVAVGPLSDTAPARAECVPLFEVPLGDVSRLVAMGGAAPDTALAFSPDGRRLAIGSYLGEVVVVDAWTGAVQARRSLAETMVKVVAWSPDGETLYAAEQSPDAFLRALDPATLEDRWALRLADRVESSVAPEGQDLFGVFSLPAAFGVQVLADGDLVVAAAHSWSVDGAQRNRSQVLRVRPDGLVAAAWPAEPADATLLHPVADDTGRYVAVSVGRSAAGPDPADLPIGGVQVLSLPDLAPVASATAEPLDPWFKEARVWEGLDVSGSAGRLFLGFGDGRVQLRDLAGALLHEQATGEPVMAGEVPIHVGVGWGLLHGGQAIYATSSTRIPWGAASPDLRPPSAHPAENSLRVISAADGAAAWSWAGDHHLQGLTISSDGDELLVGAGARSADSRRDLYGALLFDLSPGTAGGTARLRAECSTESPIFFHHDLSADGRVALTEFPEVTEDGGQRGAYRVTVLR